MARHTPKIILFVAILALTGCLAAPGYSGPAQPNHNGDVFVNTIPMQKTPLDMLKMSWGAITSMQPWPDDVPVQTQRVPTTTPDYITVTYINHATTLLQFGDITVLTDPIWAERASPFSFAGPKRVHEPGVTMDNLPDIDVILISHNHYDHLDLETLKALYDQQDEPPLILAGLGNSLLFEEMGLDNHRDMQWDDALTIGDLTYTFVECRHRSGRGLGDQQKTLWGSFVIESPAGNVYFAGDTGYSPHFKAQGERYGPFALTILPIGAYEPRWFMADVHLNPEEAVIAHQDLKSEQSLGIHFGTFQLTYEAIDQPVLDLEAALEQYEIDQASFWALEPGESRVID